MQLMAADGAVTVPWPTTYAYAEHNYALEPRTKAHTHHRKYLQARPHRSTLNAEYYTY